MYIKHTDIKVMLKFLKKVHICDIEQIGYLTCIWQYVYERKMLELFTFVESYNG
jgi:hypothetical protein